MEDTWTDRDFPVLEAAVRLLDQADPQWVSVREIAAETGLEEDVVARALIALHPDYVGEMDQFSGGPGPWTIQSVTAQARERVGQWPTPESLIERLADGFKAAAEREPDEQKRGRLREIAGMLTGTLKDLAVAIAGEVIARKGIGLRGSHHTLHPANTCTLDLTEPERRFGRRPARWLEAAGLIRGDARIDLNADGEARHRGLRECVTGPTVRTTTHAAGGHQAA